mmetsp:Transcript_12979/g.54455  ORF Transcript_12979/g.54455 Transcript_12979/m.54455 type:complete len:299 (+) Transcript_12979:523-1419(+)
MTTRREEARRGEARRDARFSLKKTFHETERLRAVHVHGILFGLRRSRVDRRFLFPVSPCVLRGGPPHLDAAHRGRKRRQHVEDPPRALHQRPRDLQALRLLHLRNVRRRKTVRVVLLRRRAHRARRLRRERVAETFFARRRVRRRCRQRARGERREVASQVVPRRYPDGDHDSPFASPVGGHDDVHASAARRGDERGVDDERQRLAHVARVRARGRANDRMSIAVHARRLREGRRHGHARGLGHHLRRREQPGHNRRDVARRRLAARQRLGGGRRARRSSLFLRRGSRRGKRAAFCGA